MSGAAFLFMSSKIQIEIDATGNAQAEFEKTALAAQHMGEQISASTGSATPALDKASASASHLGEVIVTGVAAGAVAAATALKVVQDGADIMSGHYAKLGEVISSLPGPVAQAGGAVVSAVGAMVEATLEQAVAYDKLAKKTGASVEFLSQFTEAAKHANVSSETVTRSLEMFARKLGGIEESGNGAIISGKKLAEQLQDVGVKLQLTADGGTNMADAMLQVADVFQKMPDGAEKAALAVQMFGRQGMEMIPILDKGRAGMLEMMRTSEELGTTFDTKTVAAAMRLKEAQRQLGDQWTSIQRTIGSGLIPALLDLSTMMEKSAENTRQTRAEYGLLVTVATSAERATAEWVKMLTGQYDAERKATESSKALAAATTTTTQATIDQTAATSGLVEHMDIMRARGSDLVHTQETLTEKMKASSDSSDRLSSAEYNAAQAAATMRQAQDAATAAQRSAKDSADRLKTAQDDLVGAFRSSIDPLKKLELAQLAVEVATGKMSQADADKLVAHRNLMSAYTNGFITYDQLVDKLIAIERGTLSARDSMIATGPQAATFAGQLADLHGKAATAAGSINELRGSISQLQGKTIYIDVVTRTSGSGGNAVGQADPGNDNPRNNGTGTSGGSAPSDPPAPAPQSQSSNPGAHPNNDPDTRGRIAVTQMRGGDMAVTVNTAQSADILRTLQQAQRTAMQSAALKAAMSG